MPVTTISTLYGQKVVAVDLDNLEQKYYATVADGSKHAIDMITAGLLCDELAAQVAKPVGHQPVFSCPVCSELNGHHTHDCPVAVFIKQVKKEADPLHGWWGADWVKTPLEYRIGYTEDGVYYHPLGPNALVTSSFGLAHTIFSTTKHSRVHVIAHRGPKWLMFFGYRDNACGWASEIAA
jgi:hypothetical protein